jgi:hypothetical protein
VKRLSTYSFVLWLSLASLAQPLCAQSAASDSSKRFFDITVGLGVAGHSAPSIVNYINSVARPSLDQRLNQFSTAAEFYAVPELQVAREWSMGIEYSLLIKSYTLQDQSGTYRTEMSYQVQMPSLLAHYLVIGEGYRVKLGGGLGYHFVQFDQSFANGASETLRTGGIGVKLDAIGNTKFDETFYGSIGVDLRWDFLGTLARSGAAADVARSITSLPQMNFFNAGVKFGVTFQLF